MRTVIVLISGQDYYYENYNDIRWNNLLKIIMSTTTTTIIIIILPMDDYHFNNDIIVMIEVASNATKIGRRLDNEVVCEREHLANEPHSESIVECYAFSRSVDVIYYLIKHSGRFVEEIESCFYVITDGSLASAWPRVFCCTASRWHS